MSVSLSVLAPITITDAMLTSSSAPENDYPAHNPATTYALGGRCISTITHRIYESGAAGNLNHDPTDILNRIGTPPWWIDVAPTNKWAMFDGENNSQTSIATPLTVVLHPGLFFSALYANGLEGETITVTVKDAPAGATVYSYTASLENSAPPDYWEWCWDPFIQQTDIILSDIPPYANAEITVTFSSASGTVRCGTLLLGGLKLLGETNFGAAAKPKTYSYIAIDDYGKTVIRRRPSAKDLSLTADVAIERASYVLDTITALLDVPTVVIGTDLANYTGLRTFGLVTGELNYNNPVKALLNLSVKGNI